MSSQSSVIALWFLGILFSFFFPRLLSKNSATRTVFCKTIHPEVNVLTKSNRLLGDSGVKSDRRLQPNSRVRTKRSPCLSMDSRPRFLHGHSAGSDLSLTLSHFCTPRAQSCCGKGQIRELGSHYMGCCGYALSRNCIT